MSTPVTAIVDGFRLPEAETRSLSAEKEAVLPVKRTGGKACPPIAVLRPIAAFGRDNLSGNPIAARLGVEYELFALAGRRSLQHDLRTRGRPELPYRAADLKRSADAGRRGRRAFYLRLSNKTVTYFRDTLLSLFLVKDISQREGVACVESACMTYVRR